MDLLKVYNSVNTILDSLDFGAIFEGFHKYKFALYDSSAVCFDRKMLPRTDAFMGNTSICYENEFIAIWDMETDPVEDMECLAYCMVHEMFHCFQKENNESRYPSDLVLINYPDDTDNYLKKYSENRYLAKAYEEQDVESFIKFHTLRNERLKKYPQIVEQELRAETLEGMAEYAGLTALRIINAEKFRAVTEDYIRKLHSDDKLLFDVRRISYYSGTLYYLCLDLFSDAKICAFGGELSVYEQKAELFSSEQAAEIIPCEAVARNYAALKKEKEETVFKHISASEFIACDGFICGYDPMNMFRMGDIIYCSHFVFLNIGGDVKMIKKASALKVKEGSDKEIVGYYV